METVLYSFMDIFDTAFEEGGKTVQLKKIVIPIIQRNYAQGRKSPEVDRVRSRFLDSLYKAVTEKPLTLDFIYGDIDEEGNMIPLDGQQRLTTLFLLHWYAAKKCNVPEEEYKFLNNFSYETRYSARYFCSVIVDYTPEFKKTVSEEIINQGWFPLDWEKDPTISSMLVMLDAIDEKFKNIADLWEKLKEKCITFYFLPIKDMGLTDELYIKMNSRGKPLTQFEHFKAELEREIRRIDESLAERILHKIDVEWTDLLWEYRNSGSGSYEDNIIDDEFLRYFRFICDIICYRQKESPQGRSNDEFDLLQAYFSSKTLHAGDNIKTLENFFDCWINIPKYENPEKFYENPEAFLASFMSKEHEKKKIKNEQNLNIFLDCLHSYSDKTGKFPLNRIVLLYAITFYLQHMNDVTPSEFARRIRIVNNLIQNSPDEVTDRAERSRIPAILAEVDKIILTGTIDDSIENNFNANQLAEELEKIKYLAENSEKEETLFELEDHDLLKGQISIIGLENLAFKPRFESLFRCSIDKINCAMMATGDYGQPERDKRRYQYGSYEKSAWEDLFHKSGNAGFENTKNILISLLETNQTFTDDILAKIADDYLKQCEENNIYPFRYYYIKYSEYRSGSYGKMWNPSASPYLFSVMQTKTKPSENTYLPYLKIASNAHLSRGHYGQRLIFGDEHIICTNDSFIRRKNEDDSIIETVIIPQNKDGIDIQDRIILLKNYIKTNFS